MFGWCPWTGVMPFEANIYSNLAPNRAMYSTMVSRVPVQGLHAVRSGSRGYISLKLIIFHSMIIEKSFQACK